MIKLRNMRCFAQSMAVFAVVALLLAGCGGKEEPAPSPGVKTLAKPAPAKKGQEKAAGAEAKAAAKKSGLVSPVTLDVLRLMPEQTMVAMGVPPVNGLVEKGLALAKRVAPSNVDVDAAVANAIGEMGEDVGVSDAKTLGEIASAKGFDLGAPAAVFVDLTSMVAKLEKALEELKPKAPESPPAEAGESAAEGSESADTAGAEAAEGAEPSTPDTGYDQAEKINKIVAEMGLPAVVAVVGCTDTALAEATLKEVLGSDGSPLKGIEAEDIAAEGVTIHCYDPEKFCYFVSGNLLVGGTSLDLLKATATRVKNPASIRYGTQECPAALPDEIVELIRLDKLVPMVETLFSTLEVVEPSMAPMLEAQAKMFEQMQDAYSGTDPVVATFGMNDERIELLTRMDMKAHPGLMKLTGAALPLRLAPLLPKATQVFLSIRFNEESKTSIRDNTLGALPPEVIPPQVSSMLPQILQMIGDELAVAVTGMEGLMPKAVVLLGLADPENTKALLQMLVPMTTPGEMYNDVEIKAVSAPLPVALSVAFVKDVLLVGTDVDTMKGILDLLQQEKTSGLFASLDPPLDPAVQRYGAMVVKSDLVGQILPQLAMLGTELPPEASMAVDKVTGLVREVRMTQDLVGDWQISALTVYLNPPS